MKYASILLGAGCLAMLVYGLEGKTCLTPAGLDIGSLEVGESKVDYTNCWKYTCSDGYLQQFGVGYNAGVMPVMGCVLEKLDKCCFRYVNEANRSKICVEKTCP